MAGWARARVSEIERVPTADAGVEWIPVRDHLGVRSFGVNIWLGDAGADVIGPHEETDSFAGGHEELYLVLSGRATFRIGDEDVDAPAGTVVVVRDRASRRAARALEAGTSVLTLGAAPGRPFAVAAWEFLARAGARARAGDLDSAVETVSRGVEACPGDAELLYHRACYRSLAGSRQAALTDLRASIVLDARNAERARIEPDFEPLRANGSLSAALS